MAEISSDLPTYDQIQQIYCVSSASNVMGNTPGTTEALENGFKNAMDKVLPKLTPIGAWKTVFGPAVYKLKETNTKKAPVNAWFVAQNDQDKVLVVSIAGTALKSNVGWLKDCDVAQVVRFDKWTPEWSVSDIPKAKATLSNTGPLVSRGTCFFVWNILKTASPSTGAAPGILLAKFLQDFQKEREDYTIVFTGHSLGGAVSPTLALGLVDSGILKNKGIYIMALAGASPGNAAFNEMFTQAFPRQDPYNTNVYNTLDIVPQAWCLDTSEDRYVSNILNIYKHAAENVQKNLKGFVNIATGLSKSGTKYIGLPGQPFTGQYTQTTIDDWKLLAQEGGYQHVGAYWERFGITDFVAATKDSLEDEPGVDPDPGAEDVEAPNEKEIAATLDEISVQQSKTEV